MKHFFFLITCILLNQYSFGQIEHLEMEDNTIVKIDSMITVGNEKVRDIVIFGESKLRQGQEIPISKLRKELLDSRRNLLNTRLFNDVEILIFKWTNDNHVSIEFIVDERWYIYPVPVLELTGITMQEWRDEFNRDFERLTYGLTLSHRNLTGNADRLRVDWRGGFQHRYALNYLLTGIDKERNWGLGVGGSYIKNKGATVSAFDNSFDSELFDEFKFESKSAAVSLSRRKDITRRHTISLGYQSTEIDEDIQAISPNYFVNGVTRQRYGTMQYTFFKEKRNLSEYPTDGEYYFAQAQYNGLFDKNFDMLRFTGNANYYEPLGKKFYASAGFHGRYTPNYEQSFFTLVNSRVDDKQIPRGYNDYQLFPISFATVKTELRYQVMDKKFHKVPILPDRFKPVPLKIYPKVFFDAGKMYQASHDIGNPLNDDFLYSYGAGLDLVTIYNTPFLIELSRNDIGQTSVNFGIGKSF